MIAIKFEETIKHIEDGSPCLQRLIDSGWVICREEAPEETPVIVKEKKRSLFKRNK